MTAVTIDLIFLLTYAGMAAGRLPWFSIDRTGIALLGVIALLGTGALTFDEVNARIDPASLILLFALISEQFVISGFITLAMARIEAAADEPYRFLGATIVIAGGLATFVTNDILVLIATPLLIESLRKYRLNPAPFLVAFIAAVNAGSAATIIGAPQTIIIGQLGDLRLPTYLAACGLPSILTLGIVYGVVLAVWRDRLAAPADAEPIPEQPVFARWQHDPKQTSKALFALVALLALFVTNLPHDILALSIVALLLLNRKFSSRSIIAGADWPLLILVYGLLSVTGALGSTNLPATLQDLLTRFHLMPDGLLVLTPLTLLMSNTIGNVPFSILLLQTWQDPPPGALYGLALISTLAGNLLLQGSLSNLMVVEIAADRGVVLPARDFARAGLPITLLSLLFAVWWLSVTGFMPWIS
jgi:Na+/H+ antiporter NhaD/arsenite permease-like protein